MGGVDLKFGLSSTLTRRAVGLEKRSSLALENERTTRTALPSATRRS